MIHLQRQPLTLTYPRLATIVASRFVLNALFRVAYPLVPFIAAHFGVSARAATWVVTIQVLAGLASPLGGWLGDRHGYRGTMALGLIVVLAGTIMAALAGTLAITVAALGLIGLGTAIYHPSMQAYVSHLTPFARRGRAIGVVETSWSLAGIVAVPPLVAMAERTGGLHVPFGILAVLIFVMLVLGLVLLPADRQPDGSRPRASPSFRRLLRKPTLWWLVLFFWLVLCGEEVLFIAQAPWLAARFAATPQDIGNTFFVFGLGELIGVSLATAFTDRMGKLRAPLIGFSSAAAIYLLLTVAVRGWNSYLLLFMLFGITFEFAIVASITLASAVEPSARGTIMAGSALAGQLGRAAGSRIGVPLFESANIVANGVVAAALTLMGVAVALIGVRPQEQDHESAAGKL